MISVELLIIIASYCLSPTKLPEDVKESVRCTEFVTECAKKDLASLTPESFNQCLMNYELSKR